MLMKEKNGYKRRMSMNENQQLDAVQEFSQELINQLLPSDDEGLKALYKIAYDNFIQPGETLTMNELTDVVVIAIKSLETYRQQHGETAGFGEPGSKITPEVMHTWCTWCNYAMAKETEEELQGEQPEKEEKEESVIIRPYS